MQKHQSRSRVLQAQGQLNSPDYRPSPRKPKMVKSPKKKSGSRTVNLNSMFNHPGSKHKDLHAPWKEFLSPRPAGVHKSSARKSPGFFTRLHAQKEDLRTASPLPISDPNFLSEFCAKQSLRSLGIAEALEPYLEDVHESWREKLKNQHQALDAVRKGLDPVTGKQRPGVPSQEDFAKLIKEIELLDTPVEDETVQLQFERPGHSPTIKTVRLGDIRDKCLLRIQRKNAEIEKLEESQQFIMEEIAEIKDELEIGNEATRKAVKEYEAQKKGFEKEIAQIEAHAKAETKKIKVAENRLAKEINRRVREMWDIVD